MKPTEHLRITERPGTYIVVMSDSRGPIIVVNDVPGARACRYTSDQAAKLALAALEAAGYREERKRGWDVLNSADENIAQAMRYLSKGIEIQKRTTAEAKEQAELEAEAFELATVYQGYGTWAKELSFSDLDKDAQKNWLAVARRAREMRTEK